VGVRANVGGDGAAVEAGRVGRPHGLDGSFYVTRALARLLEVGATVEVGGKPVAIVRRAGTDSRPIVRVQGVEDRAAAEALRGEPVTVRTPDVPVLAEGEWWAHELEGCAVLDGARRIGVVERLIALPSCEALEVTRESGAANLLVPMVKAAIRRVDVSAREIDVDAQFLGIDDAASESTARDEEHADGP
jgi:16S rRNA processing protein RimM